MDRAGLAAFIALLAMTGCTKKLDPNVELSQTFRTAAGFVVISYPRGMVAKQVTVPVAEIRAGTSGLDPNDIVFITFFPKSDMTLDAFVDRTHAGPATSTKAWNERSRTAGTCLGKYPGIEVTATFEGDDGKPYRYWSCDFIDQGRAIHLGYGCLEAATETDVPVLRRIVDSARL